jgi:superfamily II DNA or RNA helicase
LVKSEPTFHSRHGEQDLLRDVIADGGRVGFLFSYDPALVEACGRIFKPLRGYYAREARAWVAPLTAAAAVVRALSELDPTCFLREGLTRRIQNAQNSPIPDMGMRLAVTLYPVVTGGSALRSLYDPVLVRAMHALAATWYPERRFWVSKLTPPELKEILAREAAITAEHIRIDDTPVDLLEKANDKPPATIDIGMSTRPAVEAAEERARRCYLLAISQPLAPERIDQNAINDMARQFGLYQHQVQAVAHLWSHSGSLLADDMGLGKSRAAAIAAKLAGLPAVVLCPASLKLNWKKELMLCGERSDAIGLIDSSKQPIPQTSWIILNYENLDALLRRPDFRGFTLIIDEAHYIKQPDSMRTRRAFELAARAARRFLLTATPLLNRAEELYTLLKLSGHPGAQIPLRSFTDLYARSPEARRHLGDRIGEWILHRRKDEVLSLPDKVRTAPEIDVPIELRQEYDEILADHSLIPLAKLTRLRQVLERMKVPFIVETAESTPPHAKVVIFCQYKASVAKIAGQFGAEAVRFTGDETLKQRDAAINAFQHGSPRFLVATMDAGGFGITLTAAGYVLFASRPLTPSVQFQAEDRCHRIGQGKRVDVIIPTIANTIDADIQKLLDSKQTIIEEVLAARLCAAEPDRQNEPGHKPALSLAKPLALN